MCLLVTNFDCSMDGGITGLSVFWKSAEEIYETEPTNTYAMLTKCKIIFMIRLKCIDCWNRCTLAWWLDKFICLFLLTILHISGKSPFDIFELRYVNMWDSLQVEKMSLVKVKLTFPSQCNSFSLLFSWRLATSSATISTPHGKCHYNNRLHLIEQAY